MVGLVAAPLSFVPAFVGRNFSQFGLDHPGGEFRCLFPSELPAAGQSQTSQFFLQRLILPQSPGGPGDVARVQRIEQQRGPAGRFWQARGIRTSHRQSETHRLDHGQPKTFRDGRLQQTERMGIAPRQIFIADPTRQNHLMGPGQPFQGWFNDGMPVVLRTRASQYQ